MARRPHGSAVCLEDVEAAIQAVEEIKKNTSTPVNVADTIPLTNLWYMFDNLRGDASLLPGSTKEEVLTTFDGLVRLGASMQDAGDAPDSKIPSLYTYFGQFVAHDISFEAQSRDLVRLIREKFRVLTEQEVPQKIKSLRTSEFDLDGVYGDRVNPVERNPKKSDQLKLGVLSPMGFPASDPFHDLPRKPQNNGKSKEERKEDRAAKIGDPRNDENLILSQLHVAFMRAHNNLVSEGRLGFNEARTTLRQHYQYVVLEDFLTRVADPAVVADVRREDYRPRYAPAADAFFLPLEFTAAAFRFGHSMVRESYDFSGIQGKSNLGDLVNPLGGNWRTLPESWVIDWKRFAAPPDEGGKNAARRFDTQLVEPLSHLLDDSHMTIPDEARLAVRNLLRGYLLRLPTGQAVARSIDPERVLKPGEIEGVAANQEQKDALRESAFLEQTPLWFYILAEAAHVRQQSGGAVDHLGPVGSRIVAEVIVGLVRRSTDSILKGPGWKPTLPKKGDRFMLPDILRLGRVLAD